MSREAILSVQEVHTYIESHHILQGLSFEAAGDAVTVLIGRNGAGKSTALKTVIGLIPCARGRIRFQGEDIQDKRPFQIARMGLGFVPENMGIFSTLTVEENMRVAMLREDTATSSRLEWILDMFADLRRSWSSKAGNLSGGQKQMLAIARAMVNETALLLIDEPSKGLAPIIVDSLIETINRIKEQSVVVLVEQNFHMASSVGDHYYILDDGVQVHEGRMDDLVQDEDMKQKYLGISKVPDA